MANCDHISPESYPGKGDGGISCGKPAMTGCSLCDQEYCNIHIYFCDVCKLWLCGSCAGEHDCVRKPPLPESDVIQDCFETVERVYG